MRKAVMMPVIDLNGCLFHVLAMVADYIFACKSESCPIHNYTEIYPDSNAKGYRKGILGGSIVSCPYHDNGYGRQPHFKCGTAHGAGKVR